MNRELIMLHTNDAKSIRFRRYVGLLILFGSTLGCGEKSDRVPVAGQVTWQQQPLDRGSIVFVPIAGHRGPKIGGEVVAGRYSVDRERGPSPGEYRVEVRADTGERPHSPTDKAATRRATSKQAIPKQYNENSKLTVTIRADEIRELNFDLPTE